MDIGGGVVDSEEYIGGPLERKIRKTLRDDWCSSLSEDWMESYTHMRSVSEGFWS